MQKIYRFLILSLLLCACKSNQFISTTSFEDDISIYRIKPAQQDSSKVGDNKNLAETTENKIKDIIPPDPLLDINYEIDQASLLLAQRNDRVLAEEGILGYTVQVYSGTSRNIAEDIRDKLLLRFDEKTKRGYDRP
ncbi:MAG: hypothetical protein AAGI07_13455, partial [Bacteroidota bacterium]